MTSVKHLNFLLPLILLYSTKAWTEPGDYGQGKERVQTRQVLQTILTRDYPFEQKKADYEAWIKVAKEQARQRARSTYTTEYMNQRNSFQMECPLVLSDGWYCVPPKK